MDKSVEIFDIIADNVEFPFISVYAPQLNGVLNSCWRKVVDESNPYSVTTAYDAFLAEQEDYENALSELDSWLGII